MTQNIQKPNFIAGRPSCDQQDQAIRLVKILGFTKLESESFEDFWSRIAIKESVDHAVLMDESSLDDSSKIYFSSSGSSGHPKYTLLDFREVLSNSKIHGQGYKSCGIAASDVVATWGLPGIMNSEFTVYLALAETKCTILPIGDASDVEYMFHLLDKFRATVLLVMPSDLNPLVSYMEKTKKELPRVRLVLTGGEPLFLGDKIRYQSVMPSGVRFRSVFQTSDTGTLGYQCQHCKDGEYHIHSGHQLIELVNVNEQGIGDLVTTNLNRVLKPVVRQLTGDRAVVVNTISNCSPTISKIKLCGRSGKIIKFGGEKFDLNWFLELKNFLKIPTSDFGVVAEKDKEGRDYFKIFSDKIMNNSTLQSQVAAMFVELCPKIGVQLNRGVINELTFASMTKIAGLGPLPSGKIRSFADQRG